MAVCSNLYAAEMDAGKTKEAAKKPDVERIQVTGVFKSSGANPIDSSVSVSSIDFDNIVDASPRNTAEVLRSLPGIRAESSSGGGNSNATIRGIPLSTGGAKFLQFHEDGLPVMLFGDFDFAPADGFLKVDSTLGRVESVRGGTASTLTTNGPGGIVNFIGKTGSTEGGSAALTYGLDYDDMRVDLEYGGELGNDMYFHIGGHYQQGGDSRDNGFDPIQGGQVRASLTKEFDNGFVRITGKSINKKDGIYFPQAASISNGVINDDGVAGFNLATDSLNSSLTRFGRDVDGEGNINDRDSADGFHTKVNAIGFEMNFDLPNDINISNKARYQDISGDFNGLFTHNVNSFENRFGTESGATVFNGPNAGTALSNTSLTELTGNNLVSEVAYFNTDLDDLSNFANELRLSKSIEIGNSTVDLTFGHFFMHQNFVQDWHWSSFLTTTQNDAALISVPGQTTDGILGFNQAFGWDGNNRNYDLEYQVSAPFAAISWTDDNLTLDASVRHDTMTQTGRRTEANGQPVDINANGTIDPAELGVSINNGSVGGEANFDVDNTGWSVGANYRFDTENEVAVFARASSGASFNGERQLGNFTSNGGFLLPGGDDTYVDVVDQFEVGVKWQDVEIAGGDLNFYATYFYAEVEESNTQLTGGDTPTVINNEYESSGIELEAHFSLGSFDLNAHATFTDAEISDSANEPDTIGNTPLRQADVIWNVSPTYTWDKVRVGASWVGTTESYADFANTLEQPGYSIVNLFVVYNVSENLELSLNGNNVLDASGITEAFNDGRIFDTTGDLINDHTIARSILGRTISASIRYNF